MWFIHFKVLSGGLLWVDVQIFVQMYKMQQELLPVCSAQGTSKENPELWF